MSTAWFVEQGALRWAESPTLPLAPGQVRLAVKAAGVNRADLAQRAGLYPPPPGASPALGLEVAGVVAEAAEPATLPVGTRVCALLSGGGYSDEVVCPAAHCLPLPDRVEWPEAAAFIEVFATAWLNLVHEGRLGERHGGSALIHAGGSGVGTAAVQICRLLGHRSFVTAGSAAKIAACVALGADGGFNRHDGPWLDAVRAWAPSGVDMVLDPVGGPYLDDDLSALAMDGTVVIIGLMGGRTASVDLGRLLVRRQRLVGSTLRSRTDAFKASLVDELRQHLLPAWADGRVQAIVDRCFPYAEADAAHARLASNEGSGSIVLLP